MNRSTIRVLHLTHAMKAGGAERVLVHLCNHASINVRNIICSFAIPDDFCANIKADIRDVRYLGKRQGNDWSLPGRIKKIIVDEKIDIVHAQGWGTYIEGLLASTLVHKRRPAFIYAFHGKTLQDVRQGVPLRRKIAERIANSRTEAVVAPAQHMADDYARMIGVTPRSINVIPNGINIPHLTKSMLSTRAAMNIPQDSFVVGFIGRLDPVKNLHGVVEIFRILIERCRHEQRGCLLLVIGDGPEKQSLMHHLQVSGLQDQTILAGQRNDVADCLAAMNVLLQPSFYEGQSFTILEAMASKLPVVSTSVGGTPEIITHNKTGFLFSPRDYDGMAQVLYHIYRAPSLGISIGKSAGTHVAKFYSAQNMVQAYENLYSRLLSQHSDCRNNVIRYEQ